ncbi:hypothetical protein N431DRAFT_457800 [Stipitochalara longipes BDJ]|nr:hypothetical protein N431DRAFT_457800 [Stipitochalara longipes BDJ]
MSTDKYLADRESWEDDRKTITDNAKKYKDDFENEDDLKLTLEELGPGDSMPQDEQPIQLWPLPPSYPEHNAYEMQNLDPQNPGVAANQAQLPAEDNQPFNFSFYKPKQDMMRRILIALVIFLTILVVILVTVFSIKKAHNHPVIPVFHNTTTSMPLANLETTLISTQIMSTTLVSTMFTTSSTPSISATTVSEVSTTTQVTTQPTTVISSTTLVQSTTIVDTTTLLQSMTEVQSTTLTQLSTLTSVSVSVSVEISIQTTSVPATSIQSTTVTQTTTITSLPPIPLSASDSVASISRCWSMLENICANGTHGPADFGDCHEALGIFYCGLIQDLKIKGLITLTDDASPMCPGMLDFCEGVQGGPAGASAVATQTASVLQLITPTVTKSEGGERTVKETVTTFSTLPTVIVTVSASSTAAL